MRKDDTRHNSQRSNPNRALFIGTVLVAALGFIGCTTMRTAEIEYNETESSAALSIEDHTGDYLYTEDFESDGDIERYWAANLESGSSFSDKLDWEGDEAEREINAEWGANNEYEYEMELDDDGDHEVEIEREADDYEYQESYDYDPSDDGTSRFDIERTVEIETDGEEYEVEIGVEPDDYERDVEVDTARIDYDEDFDAEDGEEIEWNTSIDDKVTGDEFDNEFEYEIDQDEMEREVDYETASGSIELQEEVEKGEFDLELEGVANGQVVDVEREGIVTPRVVQTAEVQQPVTVLVEPAEGPEVFVVYLSGNEEIFAACSIESKEAYFRLDSANLTDRARDRLDDVAECLTRGPLKGASIEVVGFADPRATDSYNLELAQDRASSVADFLSARGVDRSRIDTRSMGESDSHADPALWPYDRRVELRIKR